MLKRSAILNKIFLKNSYILNKFRFQKPNFLHANYVRLFCQKTPLKSVPNTSNTNVDDTHDKTDIFNKFRTNLNSFDEKQLNQISEEESNNKTLMMDLIKSYEQIISNGSNNYNEEANYIQLSLEEQAQFADIIFKSKLALDSKGEKFEENIFKIFFTNLIYDLKNRLWKSGELTQEGLNISEMKLIRNVQQILLRRSAFLSAQGYFKNRKEDNKNLEVEKNDFSQLLWNCYSERLCLDSPSTNNKDFQNDKSFQYGKNNITANRMELIRFGELFQLEEKHKLYDLTTEKLSFSNRSFIKPINKSNLSPEAKNFYMKNQKNKHLKNFESVTTADNLSETLDQHRAIESIKVKNIKQTLDKPQLISDNEVSQIKTKRYDHFKFFEDTLFEVRRIITKIKEIENEENYQENLKLRLVRQLNFEIANKQWSLRQALSLWDTIYIYGSSPQLTTFEAIFQRFLDEKNLHSTEKDGDNVLNGLDKTTEASDLEINNNATQKFKFECNSFLIIQKNFFQHLYKKDGYLISEKLASTLINLMSWNKQGDHKLGEEAFLLLKILKKQNIPGAYPLPSTKIVAMYFKTFFVYKNIRAANQLIGDIRNYNSTEDKRIKLEDEKQKDNKNLDILNSEECMNYIHRISGLSNGFYNKVKEVDSSMSDLRNSILSHIEKYKDNENTQDRSIIDTINTERALLTKQANEMFQAIIESCNLDSLMIKRCWNYLSNKQESSDFIVADVETYQIYFDYYRKCLFTFPNRIPLKKLQSEFVLKYDSLNLIDIEKISKSISSLLIKYNTNSFAKGIDIFNFLHDQLIKFDVRLDENHVEKIQAEKLYLEFIEMFLKVANCKVNQDLGEHIYKIISSEQHFNVNIHNISSLSKLQLIRSQTMNFEQCYKYFKLLSDQSIVNEHFLIALYNSWLICNQNCTLNLRQYVSKFKIDLTEKQWKYHSENEFVGMGLQHFEPRVFENFDVNSTQFSKLYLEENKSSIYNEPIGKQDNLKHLLKHCAAIFNHRNLFDHIISYNNMDLIFDSPQEYFSPEFKSKQFDLILEGIRKGFYRVSQNFLWFMYKQALNSGDIVSSYKLIDQSIKYPKDCKLEQSNFEETSLIKETEENQNQDKIEKEKQNAKKDSSKDIHFAKKNYTNLSYSEIIKTIPEETQAHSQLIYDENNNFKLLAPTPAVIRSLIFKYCRIHRDQDFNKSSNTEFDVSNLHQTIFSNLNAINYPITVSEYNRMIVACSGSVYKYTISSKMADPVFAEFLLQNMLEKGIKPDIQIINNMLRVYLRVGEVASAEELYKKIKSDFELIPTLKTYDYMIDIYANFGTVKQAENCFEEMKKQNIKPSGYIYISLIKAYSKQSNDSSRNRLIDLMAEQKITPNSVSFATFVQPMVHKKNQMEKRKKSLESKSLQSKLTNQDNNQFVSNASDSFIDNEQFLSKESLLESLSLENGDKNDKSKNISDEIRHAFEGVIPQDSLDLMGHDSHSFRNHVTFTNMNIDTKTDDCEKALKIFNEMVSSGYKPLTQTCNSVLSILCCSPASMHKALDFAKRHLFESESVKCYPNIQSFENLIRGYGLAGDREGIDYIIKFMKNKYGSLKLNLKFYNTLMYSYISTPKIRYDEAYLSRGVLHVKNTFENMKKVGIQPDSVSYCILLTAFMKAGMGEAATKTFMEMKRENLIESEIPYFCLLHSQCNAGNVEKATEVFEKYKTVYQEDIQRAYAMMMHSHSRAKDSKGARKLLKKIFREGLRPSIICYDSAMRAHINADDYMGAATFYNEFTKEGIRINKEIFSELISKLIKMSQESPGKRDLAHQIAQQLRNSGVEPNREALNLLSLSNS